MIDRFLGFLKVGFFEIQYRRDSDWNSTEYKVIARDKKYFQDMPSAGWRECPEGSYFIASTIPPSDIFLSTDEVLSGDEHSKWRKVYEIFSSLPRILVREIQGKIYVRCGYYDMFAREMLKTHMRARWNPDDKSWGVSPPDSACKGAFLASLEVFSRSRRRLLLGCPDTLPDLPMELMAHQSSVHRLIRGAGMDGMRAFLIAHDMGIGKTYTSISAVRSFLETSDGAFGCVAVVPPATMRQWKKCALDTGLSAEIYHSTNSRWETLADAVLEETQVIITGAEFLRGNDERLSKIVRHCERRICILDEATKCKNRKSGNYKTMVPLSLASEFMIFLSGTPLLNDISEIENLILLGDPRYYPLKEFRDNHVREEEKEIYVPSKKKRIKIIKENYIDESGFRNRIAPFFDRETKESSTLGIILPDVKETKLALEPGPVEARICRILRREHEDFYLETLDEENALAQLASGYHTKSGAVMIFEQMALNDPKTLFMSKGESPVLASALEKISRESIIPEGYLSAKERALLAILSSEETSRAPAVIFTGFKTTAFALRDVIENAFPERPLFVVVGGTSHSRKSAVLSELKETDDGIIICTDAMTYGVEMQFASTLIQYDLPWSPMVADQRADRICRIGASGTRNIYTMTVLGSMEESKEKIHARKRATVETVLQDEARAAVQGEFSFA